MCLRILRQPGDHLGRGRVDPLRVVDGDDERRLRRDAPERERHVGRELQLLRLPVAAKGVHAEVGRRLHADRGQLADHGDQLDEGRCDLTDQLERPLRPVAAALLARQGP